MEVDLHWRLRDIENAPAFDRSCHPRCDPSRAEHPIAQKLLYMPHFKLASGLDINQAAIQQELAAIEDVSWLGYNNDVLSRRGAGISTYWTARMLRNFTSDSLFGFGETLDFMEILGQTQTVVEGRVSPENLVDTEIVPYMPEVVNLINQFVTWEMCDRIMISRVDQSQRINWHSHNYYEKKYTHAYLHIPLITSSHANMLVYMDSKLHVQHYAVGEAWIINTQHNHAVNNKGGQPRYHILCLANFEDPKFALLFDK
jgi:hypothetical protein